MLQYQGGRRFKVKRGLELGEIRIWMSLHWGLDQ